MKRKGSIALALTLILAGAVAWAGPGGHHNAQKHMDHMTEQLGLDDYQAEQFSAILREQHEKSRAVGQELRDQGYARDSDEARAHREQVHEETRQRLSTVLNAEQLDKLDEMHANRKARMQHKRSGGHSEEL